MEVVFVICFLIIICFMFGYFIGHTKGFNKCEEIYEKYSVTISKGYNDAIDDFVKLTNEVSGWTPNCIENNLSLTVFTIHQIAEELKSKTDI